MNQDSGNINLVAPVFDPKYRCLVATWRFGVDPSQALPYWLVWSDGTAATMTEFQRHQIDTHTFRTNARDEIEQHICPEILATVEFDQNLNDWILRGRGVEDGALGLHDPAASDDDIASLVSTREIVYNATVVRDHPGKPLTSQS